MHRPRTPLLAAVAVLALALCTACGEGGGGGTTTATAPAPAAAFSRGPYLTRIGETSARLRWITVQPGERVALTVRRAGETRRQMEVAASGGGATVAGLRPDTRYAWSATAGGRGAASGVFTTAPRDLSRGVDLIAFADYGAPNADWRAVARLAAAQRGRLMLTAGDNSYLVTLPQLLDADIFGPLRDALAGAPDWGTVGEHDLVFPAGGRALAGALEWPDLGERYALRYGPVQVVALGLQADAADVPFARRALAEPGPLARFVIVHRPIRAGNPLVPVIAAAHVTAVIDGHLHAYERREVAAAPGIPFLTVGTGGGPRNDERTPRSSDARVHLAVFGLLRIHLQGDRAAYRFIDVDGRVRDAFSARVRP